MAIRTADLAEALVERVMPALPGGFLVVAQRGVLRTRSANHWWWVDVDLAGIIDAGAEASEASDDVGPPDDVADRVVTAVSSFLNAMQDFITEELTVPWPQERTADGMAMAMPFVAIEGRMLRTGFGHPDHLSLEFPPIDLTALMR